MNKGNGSDRSDGIKITHAEENRYLLKLATAKRKKKSFM